MRRKSVSGTLLAALVAAGSLAGGAAAHDFTTGSATLIGYDDEKGDFFGRVGAAEHECVAGRRVKIRKHTSSGFEVVGRTRSNAKGRWRLARPKANGTYDAVVTPKTTTTAGHDHNCLRGGSGSVTVDGGPD